MDKLTELLENGWNPASEPPDDDRIVQVAYEDGSTSEKCLGFVDEIAQEPPTGKRIWWEIGFCVYPSLAVAAWKEREMELQER